MDDEASAAATKEVSGGAPSKMERDDTFRDRTEFLNRRVAKNFNGSIYFGTVVEFIDASEAGDGTDARVPLSIHGGTGVCGTLRAVSIGPARCGALLV